MNVKKLVLFALLGIAIMPSYCFAFAWLRGAWQKAGSYYRHYSSYIPNYTNYIPAFLQMNKKRKMPARLAAAYEKVYAQVREKVRMNVRINEEMRKLTETINKINHYWLRDNKQIVEKDFLEIIKKQDEERLKGRCIGFHSRASRNFTQDLFFKELLNLVSIQPVKDSWQTLHHKFLYEYDTYKWAERDILLGRMGMPEYMFDANKIYMSPLCSYKFGESALEIMLLNSNIGTTSTSYDDRSLFEKFNLEKYYERHKIDIEAINAMAKKLKYGTLLMFSLTKELSDKMCFASSRGKGFIREVQFNRVRASELEYVPEIAIFLNRQYFETGYTTNMFQMDQLLHDFDYKSSIYDECRPLYVMALAQDDNKTGKLGTANPCNPDIDIYRFHIGEDKEIARQIEEKIKELFNRIRFEMALEKEIMHDQNAAIRESIAMHGFEIKHMNKNHANLHHTTTEVVYELEQP